MRVKRLTAQQIRGHRGLDVKYVLASDYNAVSDELAQYKAVVSGAQAAVIKKKAQLAKAKARIAELEAALAEANSMRNRKCKHMPVLQ